MWERGTGVRAAVKKADAFIVRETCPPLKEWLEPLSYGSLNGLGQPRIDSGEGGGGRKGNHGVDLFHALAAGLYSGALR